MKNLSNENTRFWWVNHKQSHKYEISNGLLWSPQRASNGAKSHFYDNMRRAHPGDLILSMANAKIGAIGIVEDFSEAAPMPVNYKEENNNWATNGWMLPVQWALNPNPVKVKDHIDVIRPMLEKKYAPLQINSGNGNQGAYLSQISQDLFHLILDLSNTKFDDLFFDYEAVSFEGFDDKLDANEKTKTDLSDTEKMNVSKSRRGQGLFRENVMRKMTACPVTGVKDSRFLIASHIKPWRVCKTAQERLTGSNGLLLARHVDHLFDKGFISFSGNGAVIKSAELSIETVEQLGLTNQFTRASLNMDKAQKEFMSYHREVIFKTEN